MRSVKVTERRSDEVKIKESREKVVIETPFYEVRINLTSGSWDLIAGEEEQFENAYAEAFYTGKDVKLEKVSTLEAEKCNYKMEPLDKDELKGRKIYLDYTFPQGIRLIQEFNFLGHQHFLIIRLKILNQGNEKIQLQSLHPLVLDKKFGSILKIGSPKEKLRVFRHGWHAVTAAQVFDKDESERSIFPTIIPKIFRSMLINTASPIEKKKGIFHSEWFSAVAQSGKNETKCQGLVTGFISVENQLSQIVYCLDRRGGNIEKIDTVAQNEGVVVEGGKEISSEGLLILFTDNILQGLDVYFSALSHEMEAKSENPLSQNDIPTGWCSWYYFYKKVTEEDILRNIEALTKVRERIPLDYIQIDDGFQKDWGDWLETNKKFPHGMKWLAQRIREAGFIPGIWLSPFTVKASSSIFKEHKDWLIRDENDRPVVSGFIGQKLYGLDCSHPEVQKWLREIFTVIVKEWRYKFLKLDFLFTGAAQGKYYDSFMTRAQIYRKGMEIIREAVGEDTFILGGGAPYFLNIGLVNAHRIGADISGVRSPSWRHPWDYILGDKNMPNVENGLRNPILKSLMHKRIWLNDPDCLMVREDEMKLNKNERETYFSILGLCGGLLVLSDDYGRITSRQLEMAEKLFPPYGEAGIPLDLFDQGLPSVFSLEVNKEWEKWKVICFINWSDRESDFRFKFSDLNLGQDQSYHLFDFWQEKYLGIRKNEIYLAKIPPHGSRTIGFREDRNQPQFIGSSFHITQGGVEIKNYHFDEDEIALELSKFGKNEGRIYFYLPQSYLSRKIRITDNDIKYEILKNQILVVKLEIEGEKRIIIKFT